MTRESYFPSWLIDERINAAGFKRRARSLSSGITYPRWSIAMSVLLDDADAFVADLHLALRRHVQQACCNLILGLQIDCAVSIVQVTIVFIDLFKCLLVRSCHLVVIVVVGEDALPLRVPLLLQDLLMKSELFLFEPGQLLLNLRVFSQIVLQLSKCEVFLLDVVLVVNLVSD